MGECKWFRNFLDDEIFIEIDKSMQIIAAIIWHGNHFMNDKEIPFVKRNRGSGASKVGKIVLRDIFHNCGALTGCKVRLIDDKRVVGIDQVDLSVFQKGEPILFVPIGIWPF